MKRHTLQEWCDFLGVYAVKNNFREDGKRSSFFKTTDITLFLHKPEIIPQHYGEPCYVDVDKAAHFSKPGSAAWYEINDIITRELGWFISDMDTLQDFRLYEPLDPGKDEPVAPPEPEKDKPTVRPSTRRNFEIERAIMWSQDAATADRRTIHGR